LRNIKQAYSGENQLSSLKHLTTIIPDVVLQCGVMEEFLLLNPPRTDKNYYLRPNLHENCDKCVKTGQSVCTQLPPDQILSPEYGITVIESSEPEDAEFTLKGITLQNPDIKDPESHLRQIVNWNYYYDGERTLETYMYWANKALANAKTVEEYYEAKRLYYSIMGWNEDKNYVQLSEIVRLFKIMGFTNIYIIDNSCRSCGVRPGEPGSFAELVLKKIQGKKEAISPVTRRKHAVRKLVKSYKSTRSRKSKKPISEK
jgi:hypothetical protein